MNIFEDFCLEITMGFDGSWLSLEEVGGACSSVSVLQNVLSMDFLTLSYAAGDHLGIREFFSLF